MANVNFYGPLQKALMGATPKLTRIKPTAISPQAGWVGAAAQIAEGALKGFQQRREDQDRSAIMAALTAEPKLEMPPSPYKANQREAQQRLTDPNLRIDPSQLYSPESFTEIDPNPKNLFAPNLGFDASQLDPQEESAEFESGLVGALPQVNDPEMMSALIGDVISEEQERENLRPPTRKELLRNLELNTPAGRRIRDQTIIGQFAQAEADRRAAALLEDERENKRQVAETLAENEILKANAGRVSKQNIKKVRGEDGKLYWVDLNDPDRVRLDEATSTSMFDPEGPRKRKSAELTDDRYIEATVGIDEADTMLTNIEQMRGLAQRTDTGPLTDFITDLKNMANTFGMSFDPGEIADAEAMRSVGMKFILDIISKTKGAISEREMEAFKQASPGLGITPLGNKQILDFAEAAAERLTMAHEAVRDAYRIDGATRIQLDDAFRKSKRDWGGFGFIFPPKDLPEDLKNGWTGLTWQEKQAWYREKGLKY